MSNEQEAELNRRQIADRRSALVESLSAARGAVHEQSGGRLLGAWTVPLLAAGLGVVAAFAIRRFLRR